MRMVQVLYGGLGGHGSVALSLVDADVDRTFDHHLVFFGVEAPRAEYVARCTARSIGWSQVAARPGGDPRAMWRVARILAELRPDAVLMHSMNLVPVGLAVERTGGFPVVYVDHQAMSAKSRSEWTYTLLACSLGTRTVFLTDSFAAEARRRLGVLYRSDRTVVIGNGIDVARFSPGAADRPACGVHLVMQSRFTPLRDHSTLLRVVARFKQESPHLGLRATLAGDGPTLETCVTLAARLGIGEDVAFPGALDEPDLVALLRRADIYVHSSLAETMSTAIMQAMAVGLPVIGTDIPGIREMSDGGRTMALFPPGDGGRLYDVLARLIRDPEERESLASAARGWAVQRYSNSRMFGAYASLLDSVVRHHPRGHNRRDGGVWRGSGDIE